MPIASVSQTDPRPQVRRWVALVAGLVFFVGLLSLPPPDGLSARGWTVLCVGVLMTIYWFTEALPATLTGVLPFLLMPLLGVSTSAEVATSYFTPVLFLILGGFFLALAMEKWGLHRRVVLFALSKAGGGARSVMLAVMATTAVISMFVSNSAATLAMLPVALAIVAAVTGQAHGNPDARLTAEQKRFGQAMVLGIAYAATMGGFGTIIGSAGNAGAVAIFQQVHDREISFALWAAFGLPIVIVGVPLSWLLLSRVVFRFDLAGLDVAVIRETIGDPGAWTTTEIRLLLILLAALVGWLGMPLIQLLVPTMSDAHVSLLAAMALFLVPAGGDGPARAAPLLQWDDTKLAPWHLLILLGGGLALAEAINSTDLSRWLQVQSAGITAFPPFWQLVLLATATLFVTEFVTNIATAAALLPATLALASSGQMDPVMLGMVVALAANWGFMMPAGTPSLALAYGTGRLTVPQMAWSGFLMDIAGLVLIILVVLGIGALVL